MKLQCEYTKNLFCDVPELSGNTKTVLAEKN